MFIMIRDRPSGFQDSGQDFYGCVIREPRMKKPWSWLENWKM